MTLLKIRLYVHHLVSLSLACESNRAAPSSPSSQRSQCSYQQAPKSPHHTPPQPGYGINFSDCCPVPPTGSALHYQIFLFLVSRSHSLPVCS